MVNGKGVSGGVEWRVTVPDGSSVKLEQESVQIRAAWSGLLGFILTLASKVSGFVKKAWKLGLDDPRKFVHSLKVGLALTLVSLFYYTRPLYDGLGGAAMWAVMTVVVVFEFTVGGTLYKGFNRALATFLAGSLAIGIHSIANKSGDKTEPVILGASLFLLASTATFSRFIPIVKTRFDYGVTIFILTFSLVSVSGYRVDKLLELAQQRMSTISIGCSICLLICLLVCPVWAGEDLNLLIIRNMEKLANSLEGSVSEYFMEDEYAVSDEEPCKNSQGYKCVLNSKASEESLSYLARWEPAHGRFNFRHPWKQYLKVGASMRYCAYCIEALHASINSEMQAPGYIKTHLSISCMDLSSQSSKVLKELANSIKSMTKSSSIDFLVGEMSNAVGELQNSLKSLPGELANSLPPLAPEEDDEGVKERRKPVSVLPNLQLTEVLPIVTIVSLLVEVSARIEGVVEAVDTLAGLAFFKPASDDKPKQPEPADQPPLEGNDGQEAMKALQLV